MQKVIHHYVKLFCSGHGGHKEIVLISFPIANKLNVYWELTVGWAPYKRFERCGQAMDIKFQESLHLNYYKHPSVYNDAFQVLKWEKEISLTTSQSPFSIWINRSVLVPAYNLFFFGSLSLPFWPDSDESHDHLDALPYTWNKTEFFWTRQNTFLFNWS